MPITLQEAIKLNGVEGWKMTPSQEKFLIASTEDLLQNHPPEWFKENELRLKEELEQVFNEI